MAGMGRSEPEMAHYSNPSRPGLIPGGYLNQRRFVMSGIKRYMEDQQSDNDAGVAACLAADALEECESHPGSIYEGSEGADGLESALAAANSDEERASIQSAYDDNSGIDYCPSCDINMRD